MTDRTAHIVVLLWLPLPAGFVAIVLAVGRARLRRGQRPAEAPAVTLEDALRADTVTSIIDRTSHGSP